tara:strand:+ start:10251 stop:10472 length:222 start_codon:yes stop_codon:yes gene_type:complete
MIKLTHDGRAAGKTSRYIKDLEEKLNKSMEGEHMKALLSKSYSEFLTTGRVKNPTDKEVKEALMKDDLVTWGN